MRNPNKIQMKYEFKLDSRQSIILLAAFLLILAFAFGLGVKTGKHFAKISQPEKSADFVEDLQDRENGLEKAKEEMAGSSPHQIEAENPAEAENVLPQDQQAPVDVAATDTAAADEKKAAEEKAKAEKEAADKVAKAEAKAAEEAEKAKDDQKKKEEQAKKDAEKKAETNKDEKATGDDSKAPGGSYYTLQLASFPAKDGADKFVKNFKPFDTRKPFVTEVDLADKGKWYRVKIGQFESKEQAMAYQSIFEARTGRSTMIVLEPK